MVDIIFVKGEKVNTICPSRKTKRRYEMDEGKCERAKYLKNGVMVMTKRGVSYRGDLIKLKDKELIVVEGRG